VSVGGLQGGAVEGPKKFEVIAEVVYGMKAVKKKQRFLLTDILN